MFRKYLLHPLPGRISLETEQQVLPKHWHLSTNLYVTSFDKIVFLVIQFIQSSVQKWVSLKTVMNLQVQMEVGAIHRVEYDAEKAKI
jgi:hypothetical protein